VEKGGVNDEPTLQVGSNIEQGGLVFDFANELCSSAFRFSALSHWS